MANNKTGFDPRQTAEDWLTRKVYTTPLRPRTKRPKNDSWPRIKLKGEKLASAFKVGDNIGAIWGEPSNWAVDVDLDLEQAVLVAPHLIEHDTFVYGRRDKPASHYVFRCKGAETKKWNIGKPGDDLDIGMIVEIRSTGAQSVIPPSIHPDGDRYHIDEDVDFHDLGRIELERICTEISIAALLLLYYPNKGSRHDYVHTCTGILCHSQWPEEKIRRVMAAVLSEVQEDDEELKDRLGSVVNTIENFKMGNRVQGFTSMEMWMETKVITQLRRWVGSGSKENRLIVGGAEPITLKKSPETSFNRDWLKIPGLVGEIASWAGKAAFVEQPIFDLATGIMCTALASSNHYVIDAWDTPLQPYLMITAPTGDGKGNVLAAIQRFAHEIDLEDYVYRGFQSYYSMLDELSEPPCMACWLWDEAARHMASAKSASSQDFQTLSHVISLYGMANQWVPGTPGRKQAIPPLEHPFLTVLATAQPDQLMEALTSVAEETGFVNRFMLFDSGVDFPERNRRRSKVFPAAIKKQAKVMRDHVPKDGDHTSIRFKKGSKAFNIFDDFEDVARRRSHRGEKVWARANQNALILAGVGAVGVDPERPAIDDDIARWATQIITWSNDLWTEKIRAVGGDSAQERDSHRIEEKIKNPKKYIKSATTSTQRDLVNKGFMPHTVLLRLTRSIERRRLEQILDDLHDAELVGSTEMDGAIVYFSK